MPEAESHHELLERLGLGRYKWVSDLMDSNRGVFPSPIHRVFPPHDPISGVVLALIYRDPNILKAHIVHNLQDLLSDPGYVLHIAERFRRSVNSLLKSLREGKAKATGTLTG